MSWCGGEPRGMRAAADDRSRVTSGSAARCCRSPTSAASPTSRAGSPASAIELVSTGGTARELTEAGLEVRPIEDFTGFPEIMGGRVKTLHPKLYAGLLALRDDPDHMLAAEQQGVEFVDLVCVNLYPFERTAAQPRRDRPRGDREHRHRRPDDDPRGGEELRLRRGRHPARDVRRGAAGARATPTGGSRSARASRSPPRRSPTPPATTRRSRAGSRRSRRTSRRC